MPETKEKIGKCYTFRGLKFYAQNGFVGLHDEETGDFFVLTRREFLQRAQALSEEARRLREMSAANPAKASWLSADRVDLLRAIENMIACTQEAKDQGDRTDPEVDAWFRKHRPTKRSRLVVPGNVNFSTPAPGVLPRGKDTGKQAPPDFTIGGSNMQAKKLILPGDM